MGCTDSTIYDLSGKPLTNRKCIVLLTPPSFQTSKFISSFPSEFSYKYVSVGQLIRDQLNKKTKYSEIIMQNLDRDKKINDKILHILLKNTALQGNFMIQFSPKTDDDLTIWQDFLKALNIEAAIVLLPEQEQEDIPTTNQVKQVYAAKLKQHRRNIRKIQGIVSANKIHKFAAGDLQIPARIMEIVPMSN